MNLLIITQKVDIEDDVLGFFHGWIEAFARRVDHLTVICLYRGNYSLPNNVTVLSLGKEEGVSRFTYVFRLYRYIVQYKRRYDSVFVHMNQIYVVLAGLLWRMMRKKIGFWYAHGSTGVSLRIAEKFSHLIFTSTKSGFRLPSKKLIIVGQGIDTELFKPSDHSYKKYSIITVGRIAPVKDYDTLIDAVYKLHQQSILCEVIIVGGTVLSSDKQYLQLLKQRVSKLGLSQYVHFSGSVSNHSIVSYLQQADIFVNMSKTGSLDKAVLEAMSVGTPVLTCNEAFESILDDYSEQLMYPPSDAATLTQKIKMLFSLSKEERSGLSLYLRDCIVRYHTVDGLIAKILRQYEN